MKNIVTIVFDHSKNKLRAQAEDGGWVRFPNDLRIEGNVYAVEELSKGRSGSWIAKGDIQLIDAAITLPDGYEVKKELTNDADSELEKILAEESESIDICNELKKARG